MDIKTYKKDAEYSYTLGAFPTIELLKTRPKEVLEVYVHSTFTDTETIEKLAKPYGIPVLRQDKVINKLSDKENCFVVGILKKYQDVLQADKSHVVLVNPSNMGNMGTIIRTAIGFGIKNLAIISPGVDVFHPKPSVHPWEPCSVLTASILKALKNMRLLILSMKSSVLC